MNHLRPAIFRTLALALLLLTWTAPALAGETWPGEVIRVVDGDTIQVRRDSGEVVRVRLWGVDCAEARNPRAEEATRFARAVSLGRRVRIEVKDQDRHGRTVGLVWITARTSLNYELLWFGWAKWSRKYAPNEEAFKRAEEAAKRGNRGVW